MLQYLYFYNYNYFT